ncbi:xylulokinase [Pseudosulfitobacter koreensis]|uniref:Xylulose kinase n=1 Tax=Pseudosulfitobacter koreensis TaxID=2968472 RepID=A0ABT1Z3V1_9RHOB|nr:xylulokinase [Pseudosulfitobacter koreense]MCR8827783.1 xylulokinase [Pseudosulfitobacter koreense]
MYIGLDLGTSGVRALLVRADGVPVGSQEAHYQAAHPAPGWSEQDPATWVAGCRSALAALRAEHPVEYGAVRGIAVAGHMHGAVLLDADGTVLRPCILWNDTRSHVQAARLDAADGVRDISGNIVFPGFTAPKLAWVAEHEPDIFSRVAKVVLPKDYVSLWMSGICASEMSDAAGTAWLDVGGRDWSDRLLDAGGMRRDQMPALHEGTGVIGLLRDALADEMGLPRGVQVVAGAADNAAAACGVGALKEGDGFVSLGTSGVVLAARDGFAPDAGSAVHTFCHAVPGRWYQMGVTLACTDSLNWLARITGQGPAALTAALGDAVRAPGSLRFYPYLSGERTPHNDAQVRGGFSGLDIGHDAPDMTRAVLEGVSFAQADSLLALRATGADPQTLLAIGGGAASLHWVQMLANTLNLPLEIPARGEFGAALGAARLAICGVTGANPSEVMTKPEIARTVYPDAALVGAFAEGHQAYRAAYPMLKALQ